MIDPNEDELSYFANWYLTSGDIKAIYTPSKNPYNYSLDGITGTVIYRNKNFQVELFICKPNTFIPEHIHTDVDSFEVFLYGMKHERIAKKTSIGRRPKLSSMNKSKKLHKGKSKNRGQGK
jgi:hypothetical protein